MDSSHRRRLHYALVIAAIVCSVISLFGVVQMGAPTWATALSVLSLILILLAVRLRPPDSSA